MIPNPPDPARVRALVFDMDGTIVDTRDWHMRAWRRLAENHGFGEREYLIAERGFGKTNKAIFDEWFEGRGEMPDCQGLSDEKEACFRTLIMGEVAARPGFAELLELAVAKGMKIALATSGPRENALFILEQLAVGAYFDAVIYGGMAGKSKPHPEPFLMAAERLGVSPADCLAFEDSSHGLVSAQAAGMMLAAIAEREEDVEKWKAFTPWVWRDFAPALAALAPLLPRA